MIHRLGFVLGLCVFSLALLSCGYLENPDREYLRTSGLQVSSDQNDEETPWYNRSFARGIFGDFGRTSSLVIPESEETAALRERGRYLAQSVAACGACHGERPGEPNSPLSGGRPMQDRFGQVIAANITSDRETGIGNWNVLELMRAIRGSIGRNGEPLSIDLHESFRWMSDQDAKAISLYLLSVSPVRKERPRRTLGGFERNKWGLFPQHREVAGYVPALPENPSVGRGRYLATHAAQCQMCHSGADGAFSGYSEGVRSGGVMDLVRAVFAVLSPETERYDAGVAEFLSEEGRVEYEREMGLREAERTGKSVPLPQSKDERVEAIYQEALSEGTFPVSGPDIRGTSQTGLAEWSEADLIHYLSSGLTPSGEMREGRFCPWPFYRTMSEDDKRSIAMFLKRM